MMLEKTDMLVISGKRLRNKVVVMRLISYSGNALKALRTEFKLSQKNIANALGVTQGRISQMESGADDNISKEQLNILGKLFSQEAGYKVVFFVDHDWSETPNQVWGHEKSPQDN